LDGEGITEAAFRGLKACGMIRSRDEIVVEDTVDIPYAYVVYDDERKRILPEIMSYLKRCEIFSIGRYGSWEYMSMEDTILQGKAVAEALHG
jgi:protoporphyrinogen oxidase